MISKPYTLLNLVIIPVMNLSLAHLNALTTPILLYPPRQCLLFRICSALDLLSKVVAGKSASGLGSPLGLPVLDHSLFPFHRAPSTRLPTPFAAHCPPGGAHKPETLPIFSGPSPAVGGPIECLNTVTLPISLQFVCGLPPPTSFDSRRVDPHL